MAHKFKVGDKVNHFSKGDGFVVKYDFDLKTAYPIRVSFESEDYTFTREGRLYEEEETSLRLTGRPFNVGDRVVIGGEKGCVVISSKRDMKTPINVIIDSGDIWLTTDGRAWPGTPIICEHDWEEEGEEVNKELNEAVKNSKAFPEYQNQEKEDFDISPGFAKDWPLDHGIDDATVSPEEVRHIAEMQEQYGKEETESAFLKEQYKYARMALKLTGFEVDKEAAALITETVKKVLELGDEFSIKTACDIEARVNHIYDEHKI